MVPRQTELRQIAGRPLQRLHERTAGEHGADVGDVEAIAAGAKSLLHERGDLGTFLGENRQRFGRQAGALERVEALLGPRHVLKHTDRESSGFDVDHGE